MKSIFKDFIHASSACTTEVSKLNCISKGAETTKSAIYSKIV